MNNIHLLPTNKPSRLFKDGEKLKLDIESYGVNNQHIYITSDEEIKEGDYVYCTERKLFGKVVEIQLAKHPLDKSMLYFEISNEEIWCKLDNCKKIILTTDQDLIADGVQAIDNEFLEWFVKNQSCEFVEVQKGFEDGTAWGYNFLDYKIIIPQESKQETLEEAAERYAKRSSASVFQEAHKTDFTEGAKWQAERMYSEEEVVSILYSFHKEENSRVVFSLSGITKWFKQFKKK
jgi:hypothetical protein